MKYPVAWLVLLLGFTGCASSPRGTKVETPAPAPEKINWESVDQSTARTKERAEKKPAVGTTTVTEKVERGFPTMSSDEYVSTLAAAMGDVRNEHPDWTQAAVETEAVRRADEAKRKYENSYSTRATTEVKWSTGTTSP